MKNGKKTMKTMTGEDDDDEEDEDEEEDGRKKTERRSRIDPQRRARDSGLQSTR